MPAVRRNVSTMEIDASSGDVCRLCAESYDSRTFIPLYTDDKRERVIAKQINQLVVNLVSPDDGLPQKICLKCSKNVEMCYSFVCNVIETQNKLKRSKRVADQKLKLASDDEFSENCRLENVALKDYEDGLNTSRRSVSKSSVYCKMMGVSQENSNVIDIDCEESLTTLTARSATATPATYGRRADNVNGASASASASFSSRQSRTKLQQQQGAGAAAAGSSSLNCLYRCGVCLEKFTTKDECIRHMMSSHTPPTSVCSANDTRNSVSFDVVCKNGSECVAADNNADANPNPNANAYDNHSVRLVRDNANRTATLPSSHHRGGNIVLNNNNNNNNKSKQQKCFLETTLSSSLLKSRRKILAIDSFYKEMKKNCTRYRCDVCGRLMMSWFAFKRHLRQHRETTAEYGTGAGTTKHDCRTVRSSAVGVTAKPLIGYCKICNKLVKHFRRHNMYHTIVKLELDHPDFVKFLSA